MSLRNRWRSLRSRLVPGPRTWVGARRGVVLVAVVAFLAGVWPVFAVPSFNWTALIPILLLPLAAFLAGGLVVLVRGLLSSLPRAFLWTAASALTVFVFLLAGAGKRGLWVASLYAIVAGALAGAGLVSLRAPRAERPRGLARAVAACGLALGLALLALRRRVAALGRPGREADPRRGPLRRPRASRPSPFRTPASRARTPCAS